MTSCDDTASKRQLKLDNFHVIQKKRCDDVESEVSGRMEHSAEFSESTSDERDYSDCDELVWRSQTPSRNGRACKRVWLCQTSDQQGDKSDPEPYNYTDESDCYIDDGEDHGHHTNGSGISWHNSIIN